MCVCVCVFGCSSTTVAYPYAYLRICDGSPEGEWNGEKYISCFIVVLRPVCVWFIAKPGVVWRAIDTNNLDLEILLALSLSLSELPLWMRAYLCLAYSNICVPGPNVSGIAKLARSFEWSWRWIIFIESISIRKGKSWQRTVRIRSSEFFFHFYRVPLFFALGGGLTNWAAKHKYCLASGYGWHAVCVYNTPVVDKRDLMLGNGAAPIWMRCQQVGDLYI